MAIQKIEIGDCREVIKKYPDNFFDCIVTSPPYWNLRDYKTEPIIFDGLPNCEHEWSEKTTSKVDTTGFERNRHGLNKFTEIVDGSPRSAMSKIPVIEKSSVFCPKCGAYRGQLGLEPTPELFIKHLVDIFNIIKPKIKDTGSVFVNLGDTYSSSGGSGNKPENHIQFGKVINLGIAQRPHRVQNLPPKCLCMIPSRFAWGMIEDGWVLRNEIVWHKGNNMPESVTDRLTKSHEMMYHFVKQQKYYYDLDAIREPNKIQSLERYQRAVNLGSYSVNTKYADTKNMDVPRHPPKWFTDSANTGINNKEPYKDNNPHRTRLYEGKFEGMGEISEQNDNTNYGGNGTGFRNHSGYYDDKGNPLVNPIGKNPGDTWQINTEGFGGSHFAVFPLELVRRPILATCPLYICKKCGMSRERIMKTTTLNRTATDGKGNGELSDGSFGSSVHRQSGWSDCGCQSGFDAGWVLDPFAGSGTTLEFCRQNNRNAVGIELNSDYKPMIVKRAKLDEPQVKPITITETI